MVNISYLGSKCNYPSESLNENTPRFYSGTSIILQQNYVYLSLNDTSSIQVEASNDFEMNKQFHAN